MRMYARRHGDDVISRRLIKLKWRRLIIYHHEPAVGRRPPSSFVLVYRRWRWGNTSNNVTSSRRRAVGRLQRLSNRVRDNVGTSTCPVLWLFFQSLASICCLPSKPTFKGSLHKSGVNISCCVVISCWRRTWNCVRFANLTSKMSAVLRSAFHTMHTSQWCRQTTCKTDKTISSEIWTFSLVVISYFS